MINITQALKDTLVVIAVVIAIIAVAVGMLKLVLPSRIDHKTWSLTNSIRCLESDMTCKEFNSADREVYYNCIKQLMDLKMKSMEEFSNAESTGDKK